MQICIPAAGIWSTIEGDPHDLAQLAWTMDEWASQLDPNNRGRPVYTQDGARLQVLTGAVLALHQAGILPPPPPPPAWSTGPVSEIQELCSKLHRAELLWEHQAVATAAALGCPGAQCIIEVATGGGKTRLAAAVMAVGALDAGATTPWLYLVTNKELAQQAAGKLRQQLPKLAEVLNTAPPPIRACSYGGISKLRPEYYAGVIVDECHSLPPPTRSREYGLLRAGWRIGLSGTPLDRLDAGNALVIGLLGPVVYQIRVGALQHRGHLAEGVVQRVIYDADTDEVYQP